MNSSIKRLIWKIRNPLQIPLAFIWRRLLWRTTVIGITGSVGKTTTKELLYAILSAQAPTAQTADNQNYLHGMARAILSARFNTRYLILEIGTSRPGLIARYGRYVRPDIAIVLSVAKQHSRSFSSLEEIAFEKGQLFNHLSRTGTAIVNDADPLVRTLANRCSQKIIRFGISEGCDVQYSEVQSIWPNRLTLTLRVKKQSKVVDSKLVGTHWAGTISAAIAIAQACGIHLDEALKTVSQTLPFPARMQPVRLPCGAIVIRDEYNGSNETFQKLLEVLKSSKADRRVLIISDITDVKGSSKQRQRRLGKIAAEHTQLAIFCDEHGHHAVKAAISAGMDPKSCHHVMGLKAEAELMQKVLRNGDLVFLKGRVTHHLSRLVFAQYGEFSCWSESCRYTTACDFCSELKPKFDLAKMVP